MPVSHPDYFDRAQVVGRGVFGVFESTSSCILDAIRSLLTDPLDPARSAVLAMDCQRGIVSIYAKDQPDFATRAAAVLDAAREAGMTIVHVQVGFRPNLPEVSARNALFAAIKSSPQHQKLFEGETGAIHPALGPADGRSRTSRSIRISAHNCASISRSSSGCSASRASSRRPSPTPCRSAPARRTGTRSRIEGRASDDPDKRPNADIRVVTPDYFKTLGIPLVAGRTLTDLDRKESPAVAIINRAMTRYWNGKDAIGSRVSFDNGQTWATVIRVVGDIPQFGLDRGSVAQVYHPIAQSQGFGGRFLLRTEGDPVSAAAMLRDDVHPIDPAMPVVNVRTLEDLRERYLATPKLTAMLLAVFAVLALLVTMAGITGVIATSQRTQEFGVRIALGASRGRVLGQVIGQGLTLVAIGLAIGAAASAALTRALSAYLFDTAPTHPATFVAVAMSFVFAAAVACAGPAWRATTVDPMQALGAD